jgi:hypothetical protein
MSESVGEFSPQISYRRQTHMRRRTAVMNAAVDDDSNKNANNHAIRLASPVPASFPILDSLSKFRSF